jgi:hypothetical protein
MGPEREGPTEAILELLWAELEAVIQALPEDLKEGLPEHLKNEDSAARA